LIVLKFEDHYGSNSLRIAAAPNKQQGSVVSLFGFFAFMKSLLLIYLIALG